MKPLEGHPAMTRWNKTWKMHHIPQWARISIRLHAIKNNNWRTHPNCLPNNHAEDHLAHPLFDHYGSIKLPNCRALITQPYGNHDHLAHSFASQLGWSVKCSHPGPWHPKTYYYEFTPQNPS